jgi:hypothetical protein
MIFFPLATTTTTAKPIVYCPACKFQNAAGGAIDWVGLSFSFGNPGAEG